MEARLDVHLWGYSPAHYEEWVDVTVTHPNQKEGRQRAMREDGAAAERAEQRKRTRYGVGINGVQCAPFGSETWGRMGASAYTILERLADQHAHHCCASKPRTLRRWLAELGVALNRAQAESVAQAGQRRAADLEDPR